MRFSSTEPEKASRQQRLSVFLETMKQCGHRFDCVGVVSAIITKVLRLVDFGKRSDFPSNNTSSSSDANLTVSRTPNACPKSWTEFVNTQPNLYLRLSASLDFALSKGKFPAMGLMWVDHNLLLDFMAESPDLHNPVGKCVSELLFRSMDNKTS